MSLYPQDTIAAIATARGNAGVAVVRISGPQAMAVAGKVFRAPQAAADYEHGRFYHGFIVDPDTQQVIDEGLILIFKTPHSLTGEDVIELQCHGGDYLAHKILNRVLALGMRMAEAGEFTKRAFLNGKMDLTQAESVMDLVSAQSDRAVAAAAANLKNKSLSQYLDTVRQQLIAMQSGVAASMDFPDEVEEPNRSALKNELQWVHQKMALLAEGAAKSRLFREGFTVAILGLPNAGKSSLFNALLASERAIVTAEAGTTRDVITETLHVKGVPVTLVDTAGIRQTKNTIEILGIERTWQAATAAQAVIYVYDAGVGLRAEDKAALEKLPHDHLLTVANKSDLLNGKLATAKHLHVSVKNGEGVSAVYRFLEEIAGDPTLDMSAALMLNRRQEACLQGILENLALADETVREEKNPLDLLTVPLTDALLKIDELTGRDTREEVLDSVFSQFCVGK